MDNNIQERNCVKILKKEFSPFQDNKNMNDSFISKNKLKNNERSQKSILNNEYNNKSITIKNERLSKISSLKVTLKD